jgi:hypothetical protein
MEWKYLRRPFFTLLPFLTAAAPCVASAHAWQLSQVAHEPAYVSKLGGVLPEHVACDSYVAAGRGGIQFHRAMAAR